MSTQLTIHDGNPYWYLSLDIWAVPGNDPFGPPGPPVAGQPAYLWARVENTGDADAEGVRVDFFWADPSLQVTRTHAHAVGSAFVDTPAGAGPQEVLCLVPWVPVIVNDGHECLVAVAVHPADPLPSPLPDAFDPPTYRQVAQRNLTVLPAAAPMMLTLTVAGAPRRHRRAVLSVDVGGKLDRRTLASLGLTEARPVAGRRVEAGLRAERGCVGADEPVGAERLEIDIAPGGAAAAYVNVRPLELGPGECQLVQVIEYENDRVIGGIGFVVTSGKDR